MTHKVENWQALADRLEKLEKQNRRIKGIGTALLVLAATVVLMGQAPARRTVEANEFILKDMEGKVRGQFSTGGTGQPFLNLSDESGKERVVLDLNPVMAGLRIIDANGMTRVGLHSTEIGQGLTLLTLMDAKGAVRVSLTAQDSMSGLALRDEEGKDIADLTGRRDFARLLLIPQGEGAGRKRIFLGAFPEVGALLQVEDEEGFQATIGTTDLTIPRTGEARRRSAASVMLSDKDGKVLWQAP